MFFKHFASKNQLPGFYISETLVENGLILKIVNNPSFPILNQAKFILNIAFAKINSAKFLF